MPSSGGTSNWWPHRVSRSGLRRAAEDVSVLLLYTFFAYSHAVEFARHHRPSGVLLVAFELLFAVFYIRRRDPSALSTTAWDWVTTMCGSFLPLLLRPVSRSSDSGTGDALQVAGALFIVWGILSLRRSIGFVPANRGVRRGGAYRVVRHPLYFGYMVLQAGYLLSNATARNAVLLAVAFTCQIARVFNEERLLSRDPEYVDYKRTTRWRLVPFVF